MTLSEKGPPKVFGMGPPKSLIRPCTQQGNQREQTSPRGSHSHQLNQTLY